MSKIGAGIRQGLFAGPALGALVGLADCARAGLEGGTVLTPGHWFSAVLTYAAIWVVVGLLTGVKAGLMFQRPARAAVLGVVIGSIVFFVGAYVNIVHLPSVTSPQSLLFDAILIAAAVGLFFLLYLTRIPVPEPRVRTWALILIVPVFAAAVAGLSASGTKHDRIDVSKAREGTKNVLVFLVDSLRADHLGTYGYERATSPRFDEFAEEAQVFRSFRVASTWTKPSTASILTGLLPTAHGAVEHRQVLSGEAITIAEAFRSAGYRTAAFSDNPFVSPEFGFGQGFERFSHLEPSPFVNGTLLGKVLWTCRIVGLDGALGWERLPEDRGSAALCDELLAFVADGPPGQSWFAYVHAMEPHVPYDPPEEFRVFADPAYAGPERRYPPAYQGFLPFEEGAPLDEAGLAHLTARYDEEILCWDSAFGALIDTLKKRLLLDKTIVVVLSDHGEEFFEHGGWTHGHSLHEELVRVPLAIRVPDLGPARLAWPARAPDLFATLLGLAGVTCDVPPFGRDLSKALLAGDVPTEVPTISEVRFGGAGASSILLSGRKLIRAHRGEEEVELAYDLRADPAERVPVSDPPGTAKLREQLDLLLKAARAIALRSSERSLSAAEEEALRGLGYTK